MDTEVISSQIKTNNNQTMVNLNLYKIYKMKYCGRSCHHEKDETIENHIHQNKFQSFSAEEMVCKEEKTADINLANEINRIPNKETNLYRLLKKKLVSQECYQEKVESVICNNETYTFQHSHFKERNNDAVAADWTSKENHKPLTRLTAKRIKYRQEESSKQNIDIFECAEEKTSRQDSHEKNRTLFCAHCQFVSRSKSTLRTHMQVHVKPKRTMRRQAGSSSYACLICDRVFQGEQHRDEHVKMHQNKEINSKGRFECEFCKQGFTRKVALLSHKNVHLSVKRHKCTQCEKMFNNKQDLNVHLVHEHKDLLFSCSHCLKLCTSKQDLAAHLKLHSHGLVFKCDVCSKSFNLKSDLTKHIMCHADDRTFACQVCNKSYPTIDILTRHKKLHAKQREEETTQDNADSERGDFCQEGSLQNTSQSSHTEAREGGKIYSCLFCTSKFSHFTVLGRHMKKEHRNETFNCDICSKKFVNYGRLNEHKKRSHSIVDCKYKCFICTIKFSYMIGLGRHLASYHKDELLKCGECGLKFQKYNLLAQHIKRRHTDHPCSKCNRVFETQTLLRNHHKRRHSNGMKTKVPTKRFLAPYSRADLKYEWYECFMCNKKFNDKGNLKTHIIQVELKLKGKEKCKICKAIYYTKSRLMRHMKRHDRTHKVTF